MYKKIFQTSLLISIFVLDSNTNIFAMQDDRGRWHDPQDGQYVSAPPPVHLWTDDNGTMQGLVPQYDTSQHDWEYNQKIIEDPSDLKIDGSNYSHLNK